MEDDFPASFLIIGSQECRYDKIAEVINNAKGTPFRQNWKKFARNLNIHKDDILLCEQKVNSEGIEDTIISLLEKWSERERTVTLSQLTQVLQSLDLNSTAKALQDHFNASIVNKTPESPNFPFTSSGIIYNRAVSRNQKSKPVHFARRLFRPNLKQKPVESKEALLTKTATDASLEDERKKRCTTDWLKKRNYTIGLVTVIILVIFICIIGWKYLPPYLYPFESGQTSGHEISNSNNITHYIYASTYQEYETAVSQYQPIGNLSVNITSLNSINWPTNLKLSHAGYIKSIVFSNVTSFSLLFQILHQLTTLETLHIIGSPNSNCSYDESRRIFQKRIVNSSIISLTFTNFSSCPRLYEIFSTFLVSRKLVTLSLVQSEVDDNNILDIQTIMQNSAKTLRNLTFIGQISSTKYLFSFKKPLLQVTRVQLDIVQRKLLLISLYDHNISGEHFCETLKNIQIFENTVGVNLLDFIFALKCTQLQNLTAKVIVPSNGPFLNISSAFKGKYLEYVNLGLEFDLPCPSCKNINLLGISSLKKRIRQKSSIEFMNCGCTGDIRKERNNDRNSYVLDQRDHSNNK